MKRTISLNTAFILSAILLCAHACVVAAQGMQAATRSVSGIVVDSSGSPLPGVTVTLRSPSLLRPLSAVTGADGLFLFSKVATGKYTLSAVLEGFGRATLELAAVNQDADVRITLEGQVAESITVTAEAPLVEVRGTGATFASVADDDRELRPQRWWTAVGKGMVTSIKSGKWSITAGVGPRPHPSPEGTGPILEQSWLSPTDEMRAYAKARGITEAALESDVLLSPKEQKQLNDEFAAASNLLLSRGVPAETINRVAPQAMEEYFQERASGKRTVRTLSAILADLAKVRIPFAFPLTETNEYGVLNIVIPPLVRDYRIKVADRYWNSRTIRLGAGVYNVSVMVAARVCAGTIRIEPQRETDYFCPPRP